MLIDSIRRNFPNPTTSVIGIWNENENMYCVGGAYCMSRGFSRTQETRFPSPAMLQAVLQDAGHPCIRDECRRIMAANDAKDYETAWKMLDSIIARSIIGTTI